MRLKDSFGERVLGSPVKIRIVTTLFNWSAGELTERQLAGLCRLSTFGVRHALADLEDSLMVMKKVIGRANVWQLNKKSYAFQTLRPVLEQLAVLPRPIDFLKKTLIAKLAGAKVEKIILFGSAVDEGQEAGDIDVCIILKKGAGKGDAESLSHVAESLSSEIGAALGIRFEPRVFSADEWKKTAGSALGRSMLKGKEIYPREEV